MSLNQTAAAVRLFAERARGLVEGAGGLALAGALSERREGWKDVVVVSGDNIDAAVFSESLRGEIPAV